VRTKSVIPHSWPIDGWPPGVHPGTPERGRYVVRANKDALLRAGALVRVGRELVILGERYARWLEMQAANVPGYQIAANRVDRPAPV
jgi:hypothetical protein